MLVDSATLNRKALGERIYREGVEIWKRKQELARLKKLKEQQEIRDMLEKYYPFGHARDVKPRGLRNLRLEGLFPNKDYMNAKRFVGTLDLGRPGGGAPMVSETGKKVTRTREDPLLRFQFGSHDLRRCVDNTLRYKTNKKAQEEYKKELDQLVEEKRRNDERQRLEDHDAIQKQGWSTENTLKQLDTVRPEVTNKMHKDVPLEKPKNNYDPKKQHPDKVKKYDPVFYPSKNIYVGSKNRKLSPLPHGKENGIELVPLLAKQRRFPMKIHLDTTDVTNQKKIHLSSLWNRQGSSYLRDLSQQMAYKQQKQKEMKAADEETVRHHFNTWDGFWGRPGHGAPKSAVKKQRLDRLLYPQMVPISVH
ncbi:uncharacterized protein LOC135127327 [Zophobas morio]|uniref:uncharacterized protein LOC135127327 n=1 Tax=Zophobas morio TaxID=2755281 RepID=UPI003082878A